MAARIRSCDQLVQSANPARQVHPQLAAVYWTQMGRAGRTPHQRLCVVASRLAARTFSVMARGEPYIIRDLDGTPVTVAEARDLIAAHYQVPEDVRRRRRGRAKGEGPSSDTPRASLIEATLPHHHDPAQHHRRQPTRSTSSSSTRPGLDATNTITASGPPSSWRDPLFWARRSPSYLLGESRFRDQRR